VPLHAGRDQLSVGRDGACDISLGWDDRVSRLHARLEHGGGSFSATGTTCASGEPRSSFMTLTRSVPAR
jgi:hypothetical protein